MAKQTKPEIDTTHIKAEDAPKLERVVAALSKKGFKVRLAGSAAQRPDYNDIDLGCWINGEYDGGDHHRQKDVRDALSAAKAEHLTWQDNPLWATTVYTARIKFKIEGTKFDLMYSPSGQHLKY